MIGKKLVVLGAVLLGLTACQEKHSESYYFTHPNELQHVLLHCQSADFEECRVAYHAAQRMTLLSKAFVQNQANFGQRILHAQIRVTELLQQIKIAEKNHTAKVGSLKQQLALEQQRVKNLLAIVGLFIRI